jgi:hypothetical protein
MISGPVVVLAAGELAVTGLPATTMVHERSPFTITGGVIKERRQSYTPYIISSSNPKVINWSYEGGDAYTIFAYAPGTVTLTIKDQGGNAKSFNITSSTGSLDIDVPARIQYRSQDFVPVKIKRGSPPYSVGISNPAVCKMSGGSNPNVTHDFLVQILKPGLAVITVSDGAGRKVSKQMEVFDPTAGQPLNFALTIAPGQALLTNIGHALAPQGGTPPYSYTASPAGLNISAAGIMIAMAPGDYTVTVRDSAGHAVSKKFTFRLNEAVQGLKVQLSANKVSVGETISLKISGGNPPFTVTAPANLAVTGTGAADTFVLKGVSSSLGSPVLVQVKNGQGKGGSAQVTVIPNENQRPQLKLSASEIYVGETATLNMTAGTPPYTVTQDNKDAVTITRIDNNNSRIVANKPGLANLTVRDSRNTATFTYIRVKEKPVPAVAKLQAVITDGNLILNDIKGKIRILSVWGGKEPYTVTASNNCVKVQYQGISPTGAKQYAVSAQQAGSAAMKIVDASGQTVIVNVTVK